MTVVICLALFLPVPAWLFYMMLSAVGLVHEWALVISIGLAFAVIMPIFFDTRYGRFMRRDLERGWTKSKTKQ